MRSAINGQQIETLTDEVKSLRDEIEVLRNVLDELRDSVQWAVNNGILPRYDATKPLQITSLPLDPAAADFHERVNVVSLADLPDAHRSETDSADRPTTQQSFLSDDR